MAIVTITTELNYTVSQQFRPDLETLLITSYTVVNISAGQDKIVLNTLLTQNKRFFQHLLIRSLRDLFSFQRVIFKK